jgi:SAM-dependent methyltransferase
MTVLPLRHVPDCYLCGTPGRAIYRQRRDRMFSAPGLWDTLECPACGLVWLDPHPLPEAMGQLYAGYYTHASALPGQTWFTGLLRRARRGVLASGFGYHEGVPGVDRWLGWVVSLLPAARDTVGSSVRWLHSGSRGRLLDVGCGGGDFLAEMRSLGWEVAGMEPDPTAAARAREHYQLDVECGTPQSTAFSPGSFDVVTLNHVIEHVSDPVRLLEACGRLLRASGRLVVVTPNLRSLGRRLYGDAWMHWDPPRHLFLFTPATLAVCAERAGFEIERIRTPAQGVRPSWGTSRTIRQWGHLRGADGADRRPLRARMEELAGLVAESTLTRLGQLVGEEILLVARLRA